MHRYVILLALLLPVSAAPAANGAAPVEIELSNFRFTPATIRLEHGRDYVLHLVNRAGGAHDFSAPAFFDAAGMSPQDRAKIAKGSVRLSGGEEAIIHLTAPASGRYKLRCTHFLHSTMGMTGEILVN